VRVGKGREGSERRGEEGGREGDKFWSPHFSDQSYAPAVA